MATRKGFTFEPRALTDAPKQFGSIKAHLRPAEGVSIADPRFQAALMQHLLANEVREYLGSHQRDVAWFASPEAGHPGVSVDRMRRMLRGETMMQVADMMMITSLVNNASRIVQESVGVDFEEEKLRKHENWQLRYAMETCTCPARHKVPPRW
ncbi:hypothetical protein [Leucobacter sp. CX169]|uniref:hypothetical protein n=1 Tax=Leucobacter sp. CX169 TaxID=2813744 RepID=UPI0019D26FD1|nr:hypothetical protein [Leucobacter sp. CX169]